MQIIKISTMESPAEIFFNRCTQNKKIIKYNRIKDAEKIIVSVFKLNPSFMARIKGSSGRMAPYL
jgi:hypothetical protein